MFKDKTPWIRSLGYENDSEFLDYLKKKVIESYCLGLYVIRDITKYGVAINVFINIEGRGENFGKIYTAKSAWMVFSNGKLKCNTFLGGRAK